MAIEVLCRVLQVTRAAFYKWLTRKKSPTQEKQQVIVSEIKRNAALPRHQNYGSPRIHRELVSQGIHCSVNTVAKLMQENQIQARNKPKFRISTTDSKHNLPIAPNHLNHKSKNLQPIDRLEPGRDALVPEFWQSLKTGVSFFDQALGIFNKIHYERVSYFQFSNRQDLFLRLVLA